MSYGSRLSEKILTTTVAIRLCIYQNLYGKLEDGGHYTYLELLKRRQN